MRMHNWYKDPLPTTDMSTTNLSLGSVYFLPLGCVIFSSDIQTFTWVSPSEECTFGGVGDHGLLDSWSRYGSVLEFGLYPSIVAFAGDGQETRLNWNLYN